ncbi:MAG TPA: TerB family tellurite resistance protein, partial [Puia sp.]|nr:TerB family tellurite resistance protein [Puia sp.]
MEHIKKLMRLGLIVLLMLPVGIKANAQAQDLQQLTLDLEKLTQLKRILSDMKAGYQIYSRGYNT